MTLNEWNELSAEGKSKMVAEIVEDYNYPIILFHKNYDECKYDKRFKQKNTIPFLWGDEEESLIRIKGIHKISAWSDILPDRIMREFNIERIPYKNINYLTSAEGRVEMEDWLFRTYYRVNINVVGGLITIVIFKTDGDEAQEDFIATDLAKGCGYLNDCLALAICKSSGKVE